MFKMLLSALAETKKQSETKKKPIDITTRCKWDDAYNQAKLKQEIFHQLNNLEG